MTPKSTIIIASIFVVAIVGGVIVFNNSKNTGSKTTSSSSSSSTSSTSSSAQTSTQSSSLSSKVSVIDPNGEYKLFSDPSIVRKPQENLVFGNGQTITVEYDQSKGEVGSALFYKLYYVDKEGVVMQLTDSRFETKNGNVYSTSNKVFNSDADGMSGFLEIFIVPDAKLANGVASGSQLKLGMYSIKFETDKS